MDNMDHIPSLMEVDRSFVFNKNCLKNEEQHNKSDNLFDYILHICLDMMMVKIDNGEKEEYMKEEIDYNWDNESSNFVHILYII